MTPEAAVEMLLAALRRENLKRQTLDLYGRALAAFTLRMAAAKVLDIRQVQRSDIEAHQAQLFLEGYSPRTVAQNIHAIKKLFRHLAAAGHLLCDPTEQVTALRYQRGLARRVVSEAEMRKLLAAPNVGMRHGIRDRAILEMFYTTAMRLGELLALEGSDIDLELGLVRIRAGKGRKTRIVPLGRVAQRWASEYLTRVRPWWMKGRDHERRLFVSKGGRPFMPCNVHAMLSKYAREAKIASVYPHAIRHAAATHMLRRGADLREIQKLLGHASLRTTQAYTRVAATEVAATHAKTHPLEASEP